MSTTIDNRVLEMRFDNKQFESGVATSMSTLEKLKQKLNLSGASKGLENVGKISKSTNFSGMTAGISQVKAGMVSLEGISAGVIAKFSVINNMVNSLMATGKRMVNALTIDPIKTGFQEYETQIGAIQTILSNTRQEGTNVEIVNKALDELNTYADKTIYNFTEMTRNIGTFTAAGVKLDTSVNAIKGIANLAAVSGSTSQQASTAMYQLSQALAAGKVSLMDWNSVVNAGMGGKVFQDALIRTSELLGTGAQAAIDANGSFRESLTKSGWLTTEVLTETLNQLAGTYSKADLMAQGFSESQANEIVALAKDAEDAATKVKTFTQLWDVMKEAAQSGWAQTWRLIVGDFEEAKALLTPLADFFTGIIGKISESRNKLLEGGLGKNFMEFDAFKGIKKSIETMLGPAKKAAETIGKVKDSVKDLGSVVDDVLGGKFGNGEKRFDSLTESGYNWMEVQNRVNETLGNTHRYTKEQIAEQNKLLGIQKETTESTGEASEQTDKLTKAETHRLQQLAKMSEKQMRLNGYTEEQITAMKDLRKVADQLGLPIVELIANLDELNGRWLLINSFKNIGEAIGKVFSSLGKGFRDVFDPIQPEQLFNAVAAFHKFTESLVMSDESANNLRKTFAGLFAALDIVSTILGGGLKFGFEVLSSVLGAFDTNILEVTGNVGDAIVSFRDWLFEQNAVAKSLDKFVSGIPGAVSKLKTWFDSFKDIPAVEAFSKAIDNIKKAVSDFSLGEIDLTSLAQSLGQNLANALLSIPDTMVQIGRDVIQGFQNGIEEGISGSIIGKIIDFCLEFIASFAEALGVQSPSWKTHDIAVDTIQGFINGLQEMLGPVLNFVSYIGDQIVKGFKFIWDLVTDESGDIEWDKIFAGGMIASGLILVKKFVDAVDGISDAIGGIGDILEGAGDALKNFSKVLKSYAWDIKAKAIQKIAISIAILSAAVYALTTIEDPGQLWNAVGVIGALAAIVLALAGAMELMSKASITYEKGKLNIEGLKASILQIGATLLMLGLVVKIIGEMDPNNAKSGFIALTGLMVEVIAFMAVVGQVVKGGASENIDKVGKLMTKLAFAMILMTAVVKLASGLSPDEMFKGAAFAAAFGIFVIAITKVAKSAGNNVGKVGGMILKITFAMGLMVGVVKLIDTVSAAEALKGAAFATAFGIFVRALVKSTTIGKKQQIAKIGGLVLSMTISLGLMVGVVNLVGRLSAGELLKGVAFVGAFILFVKALVKIVNVGNEGEMIKVGGTLLALSAAVGILAGVSVLLGLVDIAQLAKGVIAVGFLSAFMAGMVKALSGINGSKDMTASLMKLVIAIGVMSGAVVALSLVDTADLAAATIALDSLMGMFALMEKSMSGLGTIKTGPILSMIVVIGALATAIYLLRDIDAESAIGSSLAISALMLAMSVSLRIISGVGVMARSALKGILALTAMVIPMAAFIGMIALLGCVKNATKNATALADFMTTITLLLIPLTAIGTFIPTLVGAAAGILALTAMVIPMAAFIGMIALLGCVKNATKNAELLTTFMSTMANLLVKIAPIGPLALMGVAAMAGLTVLMGAIGTMAVAIGALIDKFPSIQKFLDTGLPILEQLAGSIGNMLGKFVGGIGEGLSDSLPSIGDNIAEFMDTLATASENAAGIKSSSFDGVFDLCQSMLAVGGTSAGMSIIDAFTKMMGGKDQTAMEKFEADSKAFFKALKGVSGSMAGFSLPEGFSVDSINTLLESIKNVGTSMVGTSFTDIFTKLLGDKTAMEKFESDGKAFFKALKGISSEMCGFSIPEGFSSDAVSTILESIKNISSVSLGTSLKDLFTKILGDQSTMEKFESDGKAFFKAMKGIASEASDITFDDGSFESAINAAKKLANLQGDIAGLTGIIDFFIERDDLGTFGTNVGLFADGMKKLKDGMGEDGISEGVVTSVTNAGNAIIALQEALPTEGWFDGKMDLDTFSGYIDKFATAMSEFATSASTMEPDAINTAITTAYRIKNLVDSLVDIDQSGANTFAGVGAGDGALVNIGQAIGEFGKSVAEIDVSKVNTAMNTAIRLKNFASSLIGFDSSGVENFEVSNIGKEIKKFGSSVSEIDPGVVSSSITAANRLKAFVASLAGLNSSGIANFKIGPLGSSIKSYASAVAGADYGSVSQSISAANQIKSFISSLSGFSASGVDAFKSAVSSLAQTNISGLTSTFNGSASQLSGVGSNLVKSLTSGFTSGSSGLASAASSAVSSLLNAINGKAGEFSSAGTNLMKNFVMGILSQANPAQGAANTVATAAAASTGGYYGTFYSMGSYVASGFVAGIQANIWAAASAAASMAAAASAAARANLAIHSPSRVFMKIGSYVPQGFAKGIKMYGGMVRSATGKMTDSAVDGTQKAVLRISDAFTNDIDTQPTIRPVLDLSDVKSGASAISGMLNGRQSISVMTKLGSISSSIENRSQNGNMDEVVSAINKLRKDLGNVGGTSYNINGVTYDDGSNITSAVETLIRAAKIERRS